MQIIDGYCNEPNIFADDIGEYNTAIWGTRDCVLPAGERLGYELVSNNEIKIKDGVFSTQGRRGVIKKGTTETCIIKNGTQAENRNDLIVIEYSKDSSTLVESHTLKVIKGIPGETATDPDVVTGDIQAGDVLHQMPLYRVKLEGLNVVAVERLFSVGNNAIGKEFDPDKDYEIGDLTLQYNKAWKFKVKHLAGAWDESQMEETDVLTELAEQNKNFGGLTFAKNASGAWGYKVGGADPVIPFKTGDVNAVHGFCWNQNESENTITVGLVNLSTNKAFKIESNSIVFLKSISKATLKLHVKLCGAGSYWTAYLDYAFNSDWKNIASNYNGNGLSSGTYWTVSKNISIPLTNIKAGYKIAFRSRADKSSSRLISMTCVMVEE